MELRKQIETAINGMSAENGSNTPDFILAEFLTDCLAAFDGAVNARERWHGRDGAAAMAPAPDGPNIFEVCEAQSAKRKD